MYPTATSLSLTTTKGPLLAQNRRDVVDQGGYVSTAACNGHRALRWPVPLMPRSVIRTFRRRWVSCAQDQFMVLSNLRVGCARES
jgi:hypothetical protein